MINELIRTGARRSRFHRRRTQRLRELARAAAEYPLARAAEICDVPARRHRRAGRGLRRRVAGGHALRLGRRAQPQRRQRRARHPGAAGGRREVRRARRRHDDEPEPRLSGQRRARWRGPELRRSAPRQINMTQLGRVLTEPQTPPMRALFVYNANPVAMTPNQNLILRGLAREDLFTVVHEQVLTDTARFADILLPATTVFEQARAAQVVRPLLPAVLRAGDRAGRRVAQQPGAVRAPGAARWGSRSRSWRRATTSCWPTRSMAPGTRSAARRRRTCARDKLAACASATPTSSIQFVTDFPTTRERQDRAVSAGARAGRATTPSPTRAIRSTLLSPATRQDDQLDLRRVQPARARRSHMHPADAAARGIARRRGRCASSTTSAKCTCRARARRAAAGRRHAAEGPVALEHA